MLHQDLRPENIMIDKTGTVKIIDFGSTRVAGVVEGAPPADRADILGTVQYTAPEYFLGEGGSPRSDIFSLGVITYQMLTGRLPYRRRGREGPDQIAAAQAEISFGARRQPRNSGLDRRGAREGRASRPAQALRRIVRIRLRPAPSQHRYLNAPATPLLERNPLLFWKCVCLILAGVVVFLLASRHGLGH